MSVINTNQFATGFASPGVGPEFEPWKGSSFTSKHNRATKPDRDGFLS